MNTTQQCTAFHTPMYKTVQTEYETLVEIPAYAISLDLLRPFESRMQKKGLLGPLRPSHCQPLWFTAETERNVFLWKHGLSLANKDDFEFWIDLKALVNKRINLLKTADLNNPFINPWWNGDDNTENSQLLYEATKLEIEYLQLFLSNSDKIIAHASALSSVGSILYGEILGEEKEKILLPTMRNTKDKKLGPEGIEPTTR